MHRIITPPWASPFKLDLSDTRFKAEWLAQVETMQNTLNQAIDVAVQDYVRQRVTAGQGFPDWVCMTGEFYVSEASYYVNDEAWYAKIGRAPAIVLSFLVHCLERQTQENHMSNDYLGLGVLFHFDPEKANFSWVATDASSI